MKRFWSVIFSVLLLAAVLRWAEATIYYASPAAAKPVLLTVQMSPLMEVPAPMGSQLAGEGMGVFYFDQSSKTLQFAVAYRGLTGAPTDAHFHFGAQGQAGPPVGTVCGAPAPSLLGGCPLSVGGFLTGNWQVPDNMVQPLLNGQIYLNFHTSMNPKGELRGQIIVHS